MNKAKLFYVEKLDRRFTVVYTYNRDTGEIKYGVSVFRQEKPSDCFVRSKQIKTASGRYSVCPVTMNIGVDVGAREVQEFIRNNIKFDKLEQKHGGLYEQLVGVKGKRLDVPLLVEILGFPDKDTKELDNVLKLALSGDVKVREQISAALVLYNEQN